MRFCLCLLALVAGSAFSADSHHGETLRGKLVLTDGKPPAVETAEHKLVGPGWRRAHPQGPRRSRLNGFEIKAKVRFMAPDRFPIDPIHTRALLARQGGKLRMITYWCDTCSIRSFTPGPRVCCQRETTLDLRDPDEH